MLTGNYTLQVDDFSCDPGIISGTELIAFCGVMGTHVTFTLLGESRQLIFYEVDVYSVEDLLPTTQPTSQPTGKFLL